MSSILRVINAHLHRWLSTAAILLPALLAAITAWALPAAGQGLPGSTAVLEWEAPGDDGTAGIATRYEVRYRVTPVIGADTLSWWSAATAITGLPQPGAPGTTDSVVVTGLDPSISYYFMLRVADEVPNWSGFSNMVVKPAFADLIPPAAITDLEANRANNLRSSNREASSPPPTPPRH